MKRLVFVHFCVLLLNFSVFAQIGGTTQRGKATQEMASEGFFAAHNSFPLGSTIKVVNTATGEGVNAVVSGRIPASPDRIVDLSYDVWDALGLTESAMVMLVYAPPPVVRPNPTVAEPVVEKTEQNIREIDRLRTTQPLYHLLILDRMNCKANSDISDLQNIKLLYKFLHGVNGYLVAVYASSNEGPIFPIMPDNSSILVNIMTSNLSFLRDYTNSTPFKRLVTNRQAVTRLRRAIR